MTEPLVNDRTAPLPRRILRVFVAVFAVCVLVVALLISLFRLVVAEVPAYRGEAEAWASDLLGAPVEITRMDLRWRRLRPEVVFGQVRFVSGDARISLAVQEMRIGLSYRSLFRSGRLAPARIVLDEPDLTWILNDDPDTEPVATGWAGALEREERRGVLVINDGRLVVHTRDGVRIPFDGIDGRARSDGTRHELDMRARIAGVTGRAVRLDGSARGSPGSDDWRATLTFDAQHIDLPALQVLAGRTPVMSGRLALTMQLAIAGRTASHVNLDVGLSGLSWEPGESGTPRRVDRAAFEIGWQRREDGWDARIDRFTVHRNTGVTENGPLVVEMDGSADTDDITVWRVHGERAWLQDFVMLGALVVRDEQYDRIVAHAPRGRLNGVEMVLRRMSGQPLDWTLQADGEQLAWTGSAQARVPGVNGLDAAVTGDRHGGEVVFDGHVHTEFPWLFRAPLPVIATEGRLAWQREDGGIRFRLPSFTAGNDDMEKVTAQGELWWPGGREGAEVEMTAAFTGARLTRGSPYLPATRMSPVLVDWLDEAVLDGTATAGRMEWRGPLIGFPYREDEGLILVEFDARGIRIAYDERWPHLEDASAHVRFRNDGFFADVGGGGLAGAGVDTATVTVDDYRDARMVIDAGFEGTLPDLKTAYLATPVGMRAGEWLERGAIEGTGRLDLVLDMPLRDIGSTRVTGKLALSDASFSPGETGLVVSDINGTLDIEDTAVTADRIAARLYDRPLRIGITDSGAGDTHVNHVLVAGSLDRESLARAGIAFTEAVMSGSATWVADLAIPRATDQAPTIAFSSDLRGVALDLPAPLGKASGDAWALTVQAALTAGNREVRVRVPSRLDALMSVRETEAGWSVDAARARIGSGDEPLILPESGLVLSGWLGSWRMGHGDTLSAPFGVTRLNALDMEIAELEAFGQSLGGTRVHGVHDQAGWRLEFDGERLSGTVVLPDTPGEDHPLRLDLARLHLEQALLRGSRDAKFDPRTMPAVAFHIRDFSTGALQLGEINGLLRPVQDGIALDGFTSTLPFQRIELEGSWLTDGMHHSTTVRGTVDSTDVGRTLNALAFNASIDAAAGHLDGEVSWPDVPYGDILGALDGHLQVRIERGTMSDVAPGPGRMFGLLSLNALPRRLALDFSDVFRRGMGFDRIQGNFRVERGQAFTDDLVLTGPSARIEVQGRTGLAQRDYDQTAVVTASLASSLTLAGALTGGPGVGAALLIASELLKAPLEDIARVRYRITGDWTGPTIERLEGRM